LNARFEVIDEARDTRPSEQPSPVEQALHVEELSLLDEALDALPLEQRAVFTLFELDGLACQQISDLVGIPLGTVFSRLRLARDAFQRAAKRIQARLESESRRVSP
jgi:RNA polymerase sigma factor (sigma-70 family)